MGNVGEVIGTITTNSWAGKRFDLYVGEFGEESALTIDGVEDLLFRGGVVHLEYTGADKAEFHVEEKDGQKSVVHGTIDRADLNLSGIQVHVARFEFDRSLDYNGKPFLGVRDVDIVVEGDMKAYASIKMLLRNI